LLSFYTLYTLRGRQCLAMLSRAGTTRGRGDGVTLRAPRPRHFHPRWPQNVMTWDTSSGGSKWSIFGASIAVSFLHCCFW